MNDPKALNLPLTAWLDEYLLEEQANRKKKEQTTWHASSLGGCLRGVYLQRLGVKPDKEFDAKTLRVFTLGRLIEDWYRDRIMLPKLEKLGGKMEKEVYGRDEKELCVSGYADAVVSVNGKKEVLELKSINTNSFNYMTKKGEGVRSGHKMQVWIYLHLLGIDTGRIVYIEKNFLSIAEYVVKRTDKGLEKEVRDTLGVLNRAWAGKKMSIIPLVDDKDWRSKYCRFHSQCKGQEKSKELKVNNNK